VARLLLQVFYSFFVIDVVLVLWLFGAAISPLCEGLVKPLSG
jgi:hypothetical protein